MATVGHADLMTLADKMDNLSQDAQQVLDNYLHLHTELHASGGLQGAAGVTNVQTTQQVHEAQAKVQANFRELTDTLRQNAHGYANTDNDNAHQLAQIPGQLHFT